MLRHSWDLVEHFDKQHEKVKFQNQKEILYWISPNSLGFIYSPNIEYPDKLGKTQAMGYEITSVLGGWEGRE